MNILKHLAAGNRNEANVSLINYLEKEVDVQDMKTLVMTLAQSHNFERLDWLAAKKSERQKTFTSLVMSCYINNLINQHYKNPIPGLGVFHPVSYFNETLSNKLDYVCNIDIDKWIIKSVYREGSKLYVANLVDIRAYLDYKQFCVKMMEISFATLTSHNMIFIQPDGKYYRSYQLSYPKHVLRVYCQMKESGLNITVMVDRGVSCYMSWDVCLLVNRFIKPYDLQVYKDKQLYMYTDFNKNYLNNADRFDDKIDKVDDLLRQMYDKTIENMKKYNDYTLMMEDLYDLVANL